METRKFIRYVSRVGNMIEAWTFVMDHVDEFQSPNVEILAIKGAEEAEDGEIMFDAQVYGDVEGGW